jgi:hypothetical protein
MAYLDLTEVIQARDRCVIGHVIVVPIQVQLWASQYEPFDGDRERTAIYESDRAATTVTWKRTHFGFESPGSTFQHIGQFASGRAAEPGIRQGCGGLIQHFVTFPVVSTDLNPERQADEYVNDGSTPESQWVDRADNDRSVREGRSPAQSFNGIAARPALPGALRAVVRTSIVGIECGNGFGFRISSLPPEQVSGMASKLPTAEPRAESRACLANEAVTG